MKILKIIETNDESDLRSAYYNLLYAQKDIEKTEQKIGLVSIEGALVYLRAVLENFDATFLKKID